MLIRFLTLGVLLVVSSSSGLFYLFYLFILFYLNKIVWCILPCFGFVTLTISYFCLFGYLLLLLFLILIFFLLLSLFYIVTNPNWGGKLETKSLRVLKSKKYFNCSNSHSSMVFDCPKLGKNGYQI